MVVVVVDAHSNSQGVASVPSPGMSSFGPSCVYVTKVLLPSVSVILTSSPAASPTVLFVHRSQQLQHKNTQHIRHGGDTGTHIHTKVRYRCQPRHGRVIRTSRGQKYSGRRETRSFTETSPSSAVWDVAGLQPGISPICSSSFFFFFFFPYDNRLQRACPRNSGSQSHRKSSA